MSTMWMMGLPMSSNASRSGNKLPPDLLQAQFLEHLAAKHGRALASPGGRQEPDPYDPSALGSHNPSQPHVIREQTWPVQVGRWIRTTGHAAAPVALMPRMPSSAVDHWWPEAASRILRWPLPSASWGFATTASGVPGCLAYLALKGAPEQFSVVSICDTERGQMMTNLLIIYLSIYLSIHPSTYLSVCLSVCLSICLSIYLTIYLSICLSVCLSVHLSICLSSYLSKSNLI